jgi:hypothetical protein
MPATRDVGRTDENGGHEEQRQPETGTKKGETTHDDPLIFSPK